MCGYVYQYFSLLGKTLLEWKEIDLEYYHFQRTMQDLKIL